MAVLRDTSGDVEECFCTEPSKNFFPAMVLKVSRSGMTSFNCVEVEVARGDIEAVVVVLSGNIEEDTDEECDSLTIKHFSPALFSLYFRLCVSLASTSLAS